MRRPSVFRLDDDCCLRRADTILPGATRHERRRDPKRSAAARCWTRIAEGLVFKSRRKATDVGDPVADVKRLPFRRGRAGSRAAA